MIEAKHNKFFRKIFNLYIDRQLKKYFNNFYLLGELPKISDEKSILVLPNHFSWWDGFFVDLIYRNFFSHYKIYMMVLEDTVKRYWFFNHLGVFSINLNSPKDVIKSFSYASKILSGLKNFVVIFPQGELKPYSTDVEIKSGVVDLIFKRKEDFHLLFLAMKISYSNEKKPDVYFHLSYSKKVQDYRNNFDLFSKEFRDNLVQLDTKIFTHDKQKIKI